MNQAQRTALESYGGPGKHVTFKHKGLPGKRTVGTVEDHVFIIVQDYKHFIQRIRLDEPEENDGSLYAYRIGYYTWTGDGKSVKFGQYTSLTSEKQLTELLQKARERGWPIFSSPH